ncbi:MAG: zinc ABC transporter substrate-binding protein [Alphaproteobacteria bacterium]
MDDFRFSLFIIATVGLQALLSAAPAAGEEPPQVVATIPPIHSLVAAVMVGVGEPELLIRGGQSPHTFAFRPSDARALQDADVVFWVGRSFEAFVERPLANLTRDANVVELSDVKGLTLLPAREGGAFEAHGHAQHEKQAEGERDRDQAEDADQGSEVMAATEYDHEGDFNGHIWLDPDNAARIVEAVAAVLSERDPANAPVYAANRDALKERLENMKHDLSDLLAPARGRPYIVLHDAYPYFERAYGLLPVGSITVSPDRRPGARRLAELRDKISELGAVCVFGEPQFPPAMVETVVEGTGAGRGELDPLGAALSPGPELYFQLMENMARSFAACLAKGS